MLRWIRVAFGVLCITQAVAWSQVAHATEPVAPLPQRIAVDPEKSALGKRLFNDGRLSANGQVSCASCHDFKRGGAENKPRSQGVGGMTEVNTPSVFNAALNFRQFWDGRVDSLEAQVNAVITNPVEMGANWSVVLATLGADPIYREAFGRAYPDGISAANVMNAIATYERTLTTPNSRFDRFLNGDTTALDPDEQYGYSRFKELGCVACHQGINLGGNMFQRFGVMISAKQRDAGDGDQKLAPVGRFRVTGRDADRQVFRVPSLRNVALTAPYFHNGSAPTLEDAVDLMFKLQLGRRGSDKDKAAITRFLRTLTGERPE